MKGTLGQYKRMRGGYACLNHLLDCTSTSLVLPLICAGAAVTRSLGKELGSRKIRLNSINSGMVEAEGTSSAGIIESDFRKQTEATTPLGRIAQPQDIAPAVVFLASSDSSFIIGETLYISGGLR
jgi:NAD(P)-dependent dehydrogenase (short-subunit alcohol dehydrogenase family)